MSNNQAGEQDTKAQQQKTDGKKSLDITYPVSKKLNINFSAYEDRLLVKAERIGIDDVTLLMTRRMSILVLQQIL